tara:strand:+ start:614 stop:3658 length:3045 start_codon:yes stop_codon:yes gene_type:complete
MELTIDQLLQQAIAAHQEEKLDEAEESYKKAIQLKPDYVDAYIQLSIIQKKLGKFNQAKINLKKVIELKPDNAVSHYNLGNTLDKLEKLEEAEASYKKAIELKPDFAEAYCNLGVTLYKQEKFNEAEANYNKAIIFKPGFAEAYGNLGNALDKLEKLEDAEASYKKAIELKPDFALSHYNLGNTLCKEEKFDEAEASYKKAIELNPDYVDAYNNLGNRLNSKGNLVAAIDKYKQALSLKPDFVDAWDNLLFPMKAINLQNSSDEIQQQADKAQKEGKFEEAESLYRDILQTQPTHIHTLNNLGVLLSTLNRLDEAESSYKKVIELKPDHADAHKNLGNTLYQLDRLEEAEASFKKAIELKPDFVDAHNNLGIIFNKFKKFNEAEASFKKAIELKADLPEVYNNLGNTLQGLERLEEAEASYKKAIELKPDHADAFNNLGNILFELEKLEEAENSYRKAIALSSNFAEAHFNLGVTFHKQEKFNEAESSYKKATELKPNYAEAYNNLGTARYELGKLDKSEKNFKKAIELKPDFAKAWYNASFPLNIIKLQDSSKQALVPLLDEQINSKYAQVAKSILSYRLNLGSLNADSSLNETLSILSSTDSAFIMNPRTPNAELITRPSPPKKITAMLHFGRSGTGLLHSLIDGHPEVSTLPSIYFSEFFDHYTWGKIILGGWEEMADRFARIYAVLFDAYSTTPIASKGNKFINNIGQKEGMTNVGVKKDEVVSVDKKVFVKELKQLIDCHDRLDQLTFFKLVHSAYEKTLHNHNEKKIIFYHIHNPNFYAQLNFLRLAPNTKWLMMVREPLQSCESWVKKSFDNNDYFSVAYTILQMLFEVDQPIFRNDNSIGVRLEDLKEHPKKTIPALCSWLGIKENESLYQMTVQGKKWWGDPNSPDYTKDGMNPFGKTSINRKLGSVFSINDQFILRTLFYPVSLRFGYTEENLEQFKNDLQSIRPMLNQIFDFEKKIAQNKKVNTEEFMKSGPYLYLRSGMIERWNTLNKFHTYKNMLSPLKIN